MLPVSVYIACFISALSLTILAKFTIDFLKFNNEQEHKRAITDINQRVEALLSYKYENNEKEGQVIDILDYMEYEENIFVDRDVLLEEMCSYRLAYSPHLKTWIKK
jgi:hypothetical protein